jgi:VWFA-related protein
MKLSASWVLLAWPAAALGQDVPTFSSQISLVKIDVTVTRDGRPAEGLKASDFEVLDNGVRQEAEVDALEAAPLEAALLLDASASVAGRKLAELKQAVRRFVSGLAPADHASLVTFAREIRLRASPGADRGPLLAALDRVEAGGTTSLCDAVFLGLARLEVSERRPVLVVFSDGVDFLSWLTPEDVAAAVLRTEAVVYVVTLGKRPRSGLQFGALVDSLRIRPDQARPRSDTGLAHRSQPWLEQLAAVTGGAVFRAEKKGLDQAFQEVLRALKSRYVLRYEPTGVAGDGWHTIGVRVASKKYAARTREGYFARR